MIEQAHQPHPELSVERLCELFSVSRSWYYQGGGKRESAAEEIALRDQIERITLEFSGYGYRRVTHTLKRQGWNVNHKRGLRIMRQESWLCHLKKRFVIMTTDSRHGFPVYPNRLADLVLSAPDQAWVADLTYIRLPSRVCLPGVHSGCVLTSLCGLVSLARHDHPAHALD